PFLAQRIFRLVFYVPLHYAVPEKEKEAEKSAALFRLDVDGKKIQFYSWGAKSHSYVLLIHGWAGRATQFRKFIKPINQAGLRVVGFDGPAHGKSQGSQVTLGEFEGVWQKIFDQMGCPTVISTHWFGGSVGWYSAM